MRIKKYILIILFPAMSLFFDGCSSSTSPINIFTAQDDVQLGTQLDQQIRSDPVQYPIYAYAEPNRYLQNMVNEIIKSPLIQYKGTFVYKSQIIKNDSVVNAFATPGGYVYVYTGLLKFVDNEATLAGILAHEIAHAELRHATNRMTQKYGIDLMLQWILGNNPNQIAQIGANLFEGLYLLKNSRDDETQADEYSFKYLKTSKWYPAGILYFFEKIGKDRTQSSLEIWLSTHPSDQQRTDDVKKLALDNQIPSPTESNIFSNSYRDFKNTMPK